MPSTDVIAQLKALKLFGMAAAYEDALANAIRERQSMAQFLSTLCGMESEERSVRSIRYQMSIARFPVSRSLDTFAFDDTPINEQLVRTLHQGHFMALSRNIVLVGGTGTGKSHLAIAIASHAIRQGKRGRFFSVVDLVNQLGVVEI